MGRALPVPDIWLRRAIHPVVALSQPEWRGVAWPGPGDLVDCAAVWRLS